VPGELVHAMVGTEFAGGLTVTVWEIVAEVAPAASTA